MITEEMLGSDDRGVRIAKIRAALAAAAPQEGPQNPAVPKPIPKPKKTKQTTDGEKTGVEKPPTRRELLAVARNDPLIVVHDTRRKRKCGDGMFSY
jgi:hypothetical protein